MKNLYICLLIGLGCLACACSDDDEDTTPSMADVDRLESLIDKSNSDIVEFKDKYGTYVLYEFDHILDFAYQFEEATAWRSAEITRLDKADVQNAIDFLQENFFSCYTDDIIKKYFPRKLLLCGKIYGSTLGVSETRGKDYHAAVANMNSMTIAGLDKATLDALESDEAKKKEYLQQLHFIYLAGYLVNARTFYYLDDTFFDYSASLYNSLMDPNRKPASQLSDEFFYQKGFFRVPDSDTYFGTADEDLIQFTKNLILMDKDMCETLKQYEIMKSKMHLAVRGLQELGVKVEGMNENIERLMDESFPPAVSFEGETTTANINLRDYPTYTLPVNIYAEAGLQSVVVKDAEGKEWFKQTEFTDLNKVTGVTLDLTSLTEAKSLTLTVEATDCFDRVTTSAQTYLLNISVSQMSVTADSDMQSLSPVVRFNFAIERGVKKLAKAVIYLNDVMSQEVDFADETDADNIKESVIVAGLVTGDNVIKLEVYEEGMDAASYTTASKVTLSDYKITTKTRTLVDMLDLKYSFNVKYLSEPASDEYGQSVMVFSSFEGIEDKDNLIDPDFGIYDYLETPKRHTWNLVYEENRVVKVVDRMCETVISDGFPDYIYQEHTYEFTYNADDELVKVMYDEVDYVTDIVYEGGLMVSYTVQGTVIKPQYATAPAGSKWEGSVVRVDCLNAPGQTFVFTGNEEGNPFYVQGLPDVVSGEILGFPIQLCSTPYLFNEIGAQRDIWTVADEVVGTFMKDGKECQYRFTY